MSAAAPSPPPTQPAAGAAPGPGSASGVDTVTAHQPTESAALPHLTGFRTPTPRLMRVLLSVTVALMVLFGAGATTALLHTRSELGQAAGHTEQVSRIHEIRSAVLSADAAAAQQVLTGDQSDTPQVQVHRDSLRRARTLLIAAATTHPADQQGLMAVNAELNAYAAALERARMAAADNTAAREELAQAQQHLRGTVLPDLDLLAQSNTDQVREAVAPVPSLLPVVLGLLAAGALLLTNGAAAVRFRRLVNPGVLIAFALMVTALTTSATTLADANAAGSRVSTGDLATLTAAAGVRGIGYEARVQESMLVLTRGDLAPGTPWEETDAAARTILSQVADPAQRGLLQTSWESYAVAHRDLIEAGAAGQWERARERALSTSADAAGGAFAIFDQAAIEVSSAATVRALERLRAPQAGLALAAAGALLATAAAIAAAIAGIRIRLREYQ